MCGEERYVSDRMTGYVPRNKGFIGALIAVVLANIAVIAAFQLDSAEPAVENIRVEDVITTVSPTTVAPTTSTSISVTVRLSAPSTDTTEDETTVLEETTSTTAAPRVTQAPTTRPRTTRAPTTRPPTTAAPTTTAPPPTIPDVTFAPPSVLPGDG